MGDGGKGSKPRPFSVDRQTFDQRWDTIFKKNDSVPESKDTDKEIIDHSTEDQQ
jgi:hypothetical protein